MLIEGNKEKASGKSEDKQNVRLRNENSSMVLCLRNRAMRMKDCAYDLNQKDKNLGQLVNNEEAVRQEIAEIKFNECKFKRRLDMIRREKKDLVELLIWLNDAPLVTRRSDWIVVMLFKGTHSILRHLGNHDG